MKQLVQKLQYNVLHIPEFKSPAKRFSGVPPPSLHVVSKLSIILGPNIRTEIRQ
jgi:hypothetical protein